MQGLLDDNTARTQTTSRSDPTDELEAVASTPAPDGDALRPGKWQLTDAPLDNSGKLFKWAVKPKEKECHHKAAGVVPFAYLEDKGELYVLLSLQQKNKVSLAYTFLGGKIAKGEEGQPLRTAAREAHEETHGLLEEADILARLQGDVVPQRMFVSGRYMAYGIHLPDAWDLPEKFAAKVKAGEKHPEAQKAEGLVWMRMADVAALKERAAVSDPDSGGSFRAHPFMVSIMNQKGPNVYKWLDQMQQHLRSWHSGEQPAGNSAAAAADESDDEEQIAAGAEGSGAEEVLAAADAVQGALPLRPGAAAAGGAEGAVPYGRQAGPKPARRLEDAGSGRLWQLASNGWQFPTITDGRGVQAAQSSAGYLEGTRNPSPSRPAWADQPRASGQGPAANVAAAKPTAAAEPPKRPFRPPPPLLPLPTPERPLPPPSPAAPSRLSSVPIPVQASLAAPETVRPFAPPQPAAEAVDSITTPPLLQQGADAASPAGTSGGAAADADAEAAGAGGAGAKGAGEGEAAAGADAATSEVRVEDVRTVSLWRLDGRAEKATAQDPPTVLRAHPRQEPPQQPSWQLRNPEPPAAAADGAAESTPASAPAAELDPMPAPAPDAAPAPAPDLMLGPSPNHTFSLWRMDGSVEPFSAASGSAPDISVLLYRSSLVDGPSDGQGPVRDAPGVHPAFDHGAPGAGHRPHWHPTAREGEGRSTQVGRTWDSEYGDRRDGGYGDRRDSWHADRRDGGQADRRDDGQAGRRDGGYGDRRDGGYADRRDGGYADRRDGGYADRRDSGYAGSRYGERTYGPGGSHRHAGSYGSGYGCTPGGGSDGSRHSSGREEGSYRHHGGGEGGYGAARGSGNWDGANRAGGRSGSPHSDHRPAGGTAATEGAATRNISPGSVGQLAYSRRYDGAPSILQRPSPSDDASSSSSRGSAGGSSYTRPTRPLETRPSWTPPAPREAGGIGDNSSSGSSSNHNSRGNGHSGDGFPVRPPSPRLPVEYAARRDAGADRHGSSRSRSLGDSGGSGGGRDGGNRDVASAVAGMHERMGSPNWNGNPVGGRPEDEESRARPLRRREGGAGGGAADWDAVASWDVEGR